MVVAGAELVLVADRGGGGGDLAELHEVAVVVREAAVPSSPRWWCGGRRARAGRRLAVAAT